MLCEGLGVWGGCCRLIRVWCGKATLNCSATTLVDMVWKGSGLLVDVLWKGYSATLGYSRNTLADVEALLWRMRCGRGYFALFWAHFGECGDRFGGCAVEGLVCATLGYPGATLADVLWKS